MNRRDAFLHAVAAHEGQTDKSGEPYIFHPLAVEEAVRGLGEDFAVVALLHDVLEDTDHPLTSVGLSKRQFEALLALTRTEGEVYADYIRRCREDFVARVVKIADLRHNLSDERMARLPEAEAESLRKRYEPSLAVLLQNNASVG